MKISWKPALFILANLMAVFVLGVILQVSLDIYINETDMLVLMIIFPLCAILLASGIFLIILGKYYPIMLFNKLLPFICLPIISLLVPVSFNISHTVAAGIAVISTIIAVPVIFIIYTSIVTLVRNRVKAEAEVAIELAIKKQQSLSDRSIASFTRWGAIGFGLGALFAGFPVFILALLLNIFIDDFVLDNYPQISVLVIYAIMGAIAGALLGIKALNNSIKVWWLALAGAIGFGLGALIPYLIAPPAAFGEISEISEIPFGCNFVLGAVTGAVGGAALGLATKNGINVIFLALCGALFFGATHQILFKGSGYETLLLLLKLPVEAAIAGAALGATMGILERKGQTNITVPVE